MKRLAVALLALLWAVPALAQGIGPGPVGMPPSAANAFDVMGFVNVRAYGAKPDTKVQRNCGGTITGSTFAFASCSFFVQSDVGRIIKLMGANGLFTGTIAGYTDAKTVTLSSAPGWTLSAASVWVYVGNDYSAQIQAASDAAAAMGATLYFPPSSDGGCYGIAAPISLNLLGPSRWQGGLSETNAANQSGCGIVNLGTATQMLVGTIGTGVGQTSAMVYRPIGGVAPTYTTSIRDMTFDGTGDASPLRIDQINRCEITGNIFKGAPAGSSIVQFGDSTATGNAEGCLVERNNFISENGSSGQPVPSNPWFHASASNNPLIGFNDLLNTSDGQIASNYVYGLSGTGSKGIYIGGGGWWVGPKNHEANGTGFHTDYPYDIQGIDTKVISNSCDTAGISCIRIGAAGATVVGNNVQTTDTNGIEIQSGICGSTVIGNSFANGITGSSAIVQDGTACLTTQVRNNGLATYSTLPAKASGILANSGTEVDTTSATEVNLAVIAVPAGLLSANGAVRITCFWSMTASTNAKTMKVRISTTSGDTTGGKVYLSTSSTSTSQSSVTTTTIYNTNSASAQAGSGNASPGPQNTPIVTSAINTANVWYINLNGLVAGGETLSLIGYTVEVINP